MKSEPKRPGVMLYFDDFRPVAAFLDDAQLGALIRAVIRYAEDGEWIADDCDTSVRFALNTLKSKIDRDADRYHQSVLQRRYAVYSREKKKDGKDPLPFEEWVNFADFPAQRQITSDNEP